MRPERFGFRGTLSAAMSMRSAAPHDRPLVLGIETSCDDTACAILDGAGNAVIDRTALRFFCRSAPAARR